MGKQSTEEIRQTICFDEGIKGYLDIDGFADFMFHCLNENHIADATALLCEESGKGRHELAERLHIDAEGKDMELTMKTAKDLFSIYWEEQTAVVIHVGEIADVLRREADKGTFAEDFRKWFLQSLISAGYYMKCGDEEALGNEERSHEQTQRLLESQAAKTYLDKMFAPLYQREGEKKGEQKETEK